MATVFRKMSASRQLAEEMRRSIQQGKWLSGVQLPTVRQLANDYDVSLNTVHASLKQLEADDLIECRPRQGAFVKSVNQWADHVSASAPRQVAIVRPISAGENPNIDQTQQTSLIIHGVEQELSIRDLHPVLFSFGLEDANSTDQVIRQLERLRPQLTGAVIFAVGRLENRLFEFLDATELTWITINRLNHRVVENFAVNDSTQAGTAIGQALAESGARRVMVVGHVTQTNTERIAGMIKGYWQISHELLSVEYLHVDGWQEKPAYDATLRYLNEKGKSLPQAVVALGDIIAVGVMRALQSKGIRIPHDVGVISTTGLAIASYSSPPLSAFHAPLDKLGRTAGSMLLEMLTSGTRRLPGRFLPGEMVYRESFPAPVSQRVRKTATAEHRAAHQLVST